MNSLCSLSFCSNFSFASLTLSFNSLCSQKLSKIVTYDKTVGLLVPYTATPIAPSAKSALESSFSSTTSELFLSTTKTFNLIVNFFLLSSFGWHQHSYLDAFPCCFFQ